MRVAVCYSGQLRWARMVQPNHLLRLWNLLRDRYHAEIDLFVVSDRCNTTRSRTAQGQFQWISTPVPEHVRQSWLAAFEPYVTEQHVTWLDAPPPAPTAFRDNLWAQFQKLASVWSAAAATGHTYDYVLRLRPDVFFDTDLQWPQPHEILSNYESVYSYAGDSVHIFSGTHLASVVRWCQAVRPEHFPAQHGQATRFPLYEDLFPTLARELNLSLRFVPELGCRWYGKNCRWFEGLDWKGWADWNAREYEYPFDSSRLQQAVQQPHQQWPWNEYVSQWWGTPNATLPPEPILQLWFSASPPRWIPPHLPCRNRWTPDCLGLVPCAGTAVRMGHLPKFLLPLPDCGNGNTSLLQHTLHHLDTTAIARAWIGTSPANEPLVTAALQPWQQQQKPLDVHTAVVGNTVTMSETVHRLLPLLARKFILVMPDTYWTSHQWSLADLSRSLDHYPLAVMVWRIRPDQFGKLGQCRVVNGEVVEHRDKDPQCQFEYSWGVIGWQATAGEQLLQPRTPHVGYMIDAALRTGLKVAALVCDHETDTYFDCGTPREYFRLIRTLTDNSDF